MDTDSKFSPTDFSKFHNISMYDIFMRDAQDRFDTSDYPESNVHGIRCLNKRAIGFMKDELKGKVMTHCIALRAKTYTYKVNGEVKNKLKGVLLN